MNRVFPPAGEPHHPRQPDPTLTPPARDPTTIDNLLREARRLLAARAFAEVVEKLEVHRPAEWAAVDDSGARLLRLLGQAQLGKADLVAARDSLEYLRALQHEKPRLGRDEFAAALSDLCKCYRGQGLDALAAECQEEVRRLLHGA
jgi:hypothetical protein